MTGWEKVRPLLRDRAIDQSLGRKDNGNCLSNLSSAGKSKKPCPAPCYDSIKTTTKGDSPHWDDCGETITGRCLLPMLERKKTEIRPAFSASRPVVSLLFFATFAFGLFHPCLNPLPKSHDHCLQVNKLYDGLCSFRSSYNRINESEGC